MASTNNSSNLQEGLTTRLKRYCGLDCLSSDNNMDTDNQDNDNNNDNNNNVNEDNNNNNKDNNTDVGEDETTQEKPKISDRMLSWVATGIRKKARRTQPETPPPQSELEWLYNAGTTGEKDFLTQESLSSPACMKRSIDNVEEPEQEPLPKFTRRPGGSIERSPRQANTNTRFASSRFQSTNLSADEAKLPATKSPLVARNLRFKGLKRKHQGTKLKEPPIDTATAEKNSQRLKEAKLKLKETKLKEPPIDTATKEKNSQRSKGMKLKLKAAKLKEPPIGTATKEKNSQSLKGTNLKLKATKLKEPPMDTEEKNYQPESRPMEETATKLKNPPNDSTAKEKMAQPRSSKMKDSDVSDPLNKQKAVSTPESLSAEVRLRQKLAQRSSPNVARLRQEERTAPDIPRAFLETPTSIDRPDHEAGRFDSVRCNVFNEKEQADPETAFSLPGNDARSVDECNDKEKEEEEEDEEHEVIDLTDSISEASPPPSPKASRKPTPDGNQPNDLMRALLGDAEECATLVKQEINTGKPHSQSQESSAVLHPKKLLEFALQEAAQEPVTAVSELRTFASVKRLIEERLEIAETFIKSCDETLIQYKAYKDDDHRPISSSKLCEISLDQLFGMAKFFLDEMDDAHEELSSSLAATDERQLIGSFQHIFLHEGKLDFSRFLLSLVDPNATQTALLSESKEKVCDGMAYESAGGQKSHAFPRSATTEQINGQLTFPMRVIAAGIMGGDFQQHLECTRKICPLLKSEDHSKQEVRSIVRQWMKGGIFPRLILFLEDEQRPVLQVEAIRALTSLLPCAKDTEDNKAVISSLVKLISNPNLLVSKQAIKGLGDLAKEAPLRDTILSAGVMKPLLRKLEEDPHRLTCATLAQLCDEPAPDFPWVQPALDILSRLLFSTTTELLGEVCHALSNISSGGSIEKIRAIIGLGISRRLVELLGPDNETVVQRWAVATVKNICRGDDSQKRFITKERPELRRLASHPNERIQMDAFRAIAYIADGSSEQIQFLVDNQIVPLVIEASCKEEPHIRSRAYSAMINANRRGSALQVAFFVRKGCISAMCSRLSVHVDKRCVLKTLRVLAKMYLALERQEDQAFLVHCFTQQGGEVRVTDLLNLSTSQEIKSAARVVLRHYGQSDGRRRHDACADQSSASDI